MRASWCFPAFTLGEYFQNDSLRVTEHQNSLLGQTLGASAYNIARAAAEKLDASKETWVS